LAVKPVLLIKQLTSFIAFADSIPAGYWAKEVIKTIFNLPEATRVLMTSTMIQDRWKSGDIERDIKTAMSSSEFAKFRTRPSLINALMIPVKLGDIGSIIVGGYPVYKYHRDRGMTHEQAIRAFESIAESTQQSADLSEQSTWQRGGSFAKLFTMFMTSPNQYLRKEIGAIRNLAAGRIDKKQFFKTIAIYHVLLPMFFQWVSDRFTWDDDEEKRAVILGPLNGYFILGDALDYIVRRAVGTQTFDMELPIVSMVKDFGAAMELLDPDDLDTEDFIRAIRGLAGAAADITVMSPVGPPLPVQQVVDLGFGFNDVLSGDYEKGLAELAGWTPYVAQKAAEKE
jgi:hypothetical protein